MSFLLESLNRFPDSKLATVVHINPVDEDAAEQYAQLGASRIVAVMADRAVLPRLRSLTAHDVKLEVLDAAVSHRPGEMQWLRFNMRELSGLLEPGSALHAIYPRLQLVERRSVNAMTLEELLRRVAVAPPPNGEHNLLVLEAPGLEISSLDAVSPELLSSFDLIVVRAIRDGLFERPLGDPSTDGSVDARGGFCHLVAQVDELDPLWVTTLLRYDSAAAHQAKLLRQVEELTGKLELTAREHQSEVQRLTQALDEQTRLAIERGRQMQELETGRLRASTVEQEQVVQIAQLLQANSCAEKQAAEHQMQIQELTRTKDLAEERAREHLAQIEQLAQASNEQQRLALERKNQMEQLSKAHEHHLNTLTERLVQSERQSRERLAKLVELQRRITQLEEEQRVTAGRQQRLLGELVSAEAQLELIKDVTLKEPGL